MTPKLTDYFKTISQTESRKQHLTFKKQECTKPSFQLFKKGFIRNITKLYDIHGGTIFKLPNSKAKVLTETKKIPDCRNGKCLYQAVMMPESNISNPTHSIKKNDNTQKKK